MNTTLIPSRDRSELSRSDCDRGVLVFDIALHRIAGVAVLRLQGELVFGRPVDSLRVAGRELIASNQARVVLDLANVTRIDSSGLGALLAMRVDLEGAEGGLVLLAPSDRLNSLLTTTRVSSVFQIADTEMAAVRLLADIRRTASQRDQDDSAKS